MDNVLLLVRTGPQRVQCQSLLLNLLQDEAEDHGLYRCTDLRMDRNSSKQNFCPARPLTYPSNPTFSSPLRPLQTYR